MPTARSPAPSIARRVQPTIHGRYMAAPSFEPCPCTPQATTCGNNRYSAAPRSSDETGSRQRDSSHTMPRPPKTRWPIIQVRGARPRLPWRKVNSAVGGYSPGT